MAASDWVGRLRRRGAVLSLAGAVTACGTVRPGGVDPVVARSDLTSTPARLTRQGADSRPPTAELFGARGLAEYVALGLARNPSLAALRARVEAAGERSAQVEALPNPVFSWTEFVEELETRTGPNERRYRLDQPLPWPGTRAARGDLADAEAAVLVAELGAREALLAERIENAWLDLAFAHRRRAILIEEVALLDSLTVVVEARVSSGRSREDGLELEIARARSEDDLTSVAASLVPLSARLSALCGVPFDGAPLEAELDALDFTLANAAGFEDAARAGSPRLERLTSEIASAEAAREVAAHADRPSLAVGVEYLEIGDAVDPTTPGAGDDPLALRFSIGIPLWRGAYAAARREAERSERAARLELDAERLTLDAELAAAGFELADAERRQASCEQTLLPRARESYELVRAAYSTGRATLTDLIDAERAVLDLDLELARTRCDRGRALAHLRALAGGLP